MENRPYLNAQLDVACLGVQYIMHCIMLYIMHCILLYSTLCFDFCWHCILLCMMHCIPQYIIHFVIPACWVRDMSVCVHYFGSLTHFSIEHFLLTMCSSIVFSCQWTIYRFHYLICHSKDHSIVHCKIISIHSCKFPKPVNHPSAKKIPQYRLS